MSKSKRELHAELRAKYLDQVTAFFTANGEEVLRTASGEISIPVLDSEQNEEWVQIVFKVPTGSREDGEGFDGYSVAEDYAQKVENDIAKKAEAAEKKAKKIARDEAAREAKRKAREEHQKEKTTD